MESQERLRDYLTIAPTLIVVASFGPYIPGLPGIQLSQIVIYPLAVLVVFRCLSGEYVISERVRGIAAIWFALALLTVVNTVWPPDVIRREAGGSQISALAVLDNFTLALAVMLVCGARRAHRIRSTRACTTPLVFASTVLVLLLSLNTLGLIAVRLNLINQSIFRWFWSSTSGVIVGGSVSEYSGRFTGVFNQPYEAGAAYAIGLCAGGFAIRSLPHGLIRKVAVLAVALNLLSILLVPSKAIVFGSALCLGLLLLRRLRVLGLGATVRTLARVTLVVGTILAAAGTAGLLASEDPNGAAYVDVALGGDLTRITGGRGLVIEQVTRTSASSTLTGYGFSHSFGLKSRLAGPIDSGPYAAALGGGIVGLILYSILLMAVFRISFSRESRPVDVNTFAAVVIPLILILQLGGPLFLVNRASSIAWTFVTLLAGNYGATLRSSGEGSPHHPDRDRSSPVEAARREVSTKLAP